MTISIKQGWTFATEQLAKEIDPSALTLTDEKVAELIKSGKYSTVIELSEAAGIDVSAINLKSGWINSFTQIDDKINS